MEEITNENASVFRERFHDFGDGFILKFEQVYHTSGERIVSVWILAKDAEERKSNIVLIQTSGVTETVFREGPWSLRVMAKGLPIHWFEEDVWIAFQPYSVVMDTIEDYRQSTFYVRGSNCKWEIQSSEH